MWDALELQKVRIRQSFQFGIPGSKCAAVVLEIVHKLFQPFDVLRYGLIPVRDFVRRGELPGRLRKDINAGFSLRLFVPVLVQKIVVAHGCIIRNTV
nr:MAG TPA: hypothetical protein [Caudoviricetes sp.]